MLQKLAIKHYAACGFPFLNNLIPPPLLTTKQLTISIWTLILSCFPDTVLDMMEEACKSHGYYLISLQTDGGDIKLLFQNEEQTEIWMSTISNFLGKRNVERFNYK